LCLAKGIVVTKTHHRPETWNRGIQKIKAELGAIVTKVIAKTAETRAKAPDRSQALADAWKRANELANQIETYAAKQQEASPSSSPGHDKPHEEKSKFSGLASFFQKKK
jgi:hypothetical protein